MLNLAFDPHLARHTGSKSCTTTSSTLSNEETQKTTHKELTANQILEHAKINPETNYLVELRGHHDRESFEDRPNHEIHLQEHMHFVSVARCPTPVS